MSFYVDEIVNKVTAPRMTLRIFGLFNTFGKFNGNAESAQVEIGGESSRVVDSSTDYIDAIVPNVEGECDVVVTFGDVSKSAGHVIVKKLYELPSLNEPKNYSASDFFGYIVGLFPCGRLFDFSEGSNINKLIKSLAASMVFLWSYVILLVKSFMPFSLSGINQREKDAGLPISPFASQDDESRIVQYYESQKLTRYPNVYNITQAAIDYSGDESPIIREETSNTYLVYTPNGKQLSHKQAKMYSAASILGLPAAALVDAYGVPIVDANDRQIIAEADDRNIGNIGD